MTAERCTLPIARITRSEKSTYAPASYRRSSAPVSVAMDRMEIPLNASSRVLTPCSFMATCCTSPTARTTGFGRSSPLNCSGGLYRRREASMRFVIIMTIGAVLSLGNIANAQSWQPPSDSQRCPSKWGAGDQRGSGNHMSRETVLRASKLIRTGEVFELGHVLNDSMPLSAGRRFEVLTKRTRNDPGSNHRGSNEELIVAEMGQVGTQFDTFSHQMIGNSMYNCFKLEDISTRNGFTKLGVQNVGALMTRGVMIDVAALKGVDMLPDTYEITVQDLQQGLAAEKLTLQPGDAVIIHTGWG